MTDKKLGEYGMERAEKSLAVQQQWLSVTDVLQQVALIQQVMASAMKSGEHYGKPFESAPKPTLLKPGAEKLCLLFRLSPSYNVNRILTDDHGSVIPGHREYEVVCTLTHIPSGTKWGEGVGSCSTLEAKYRFRTGPVTLTEQDVPREYWDLRKTNPARAQESIGGPGHIARKDGAGKWKVAIQGDPVEHANPADHYNTVLKMAAKRAQVAAVLSATAASDIFMQDLEDIKENLEKYESQTETIVDPQRNEDDAEPAPPEKPEPKKGGRTDYAKRMVDAISSRTGTPATFIVRQHSKWKDEDGKEHSEETIEQLTPRWLGKTISQLEKTCAEFKLDVKP